LESGKKAEDDAASRIIRVRLRETRQHLRCKRDQRKPVIGDCCAKVKPRVAVRGFIKESRSQQLALPALGKQELLVSDVSYQ
jgi:hypothetical protein